MDKGSQAASHFLQGAIFFESREWVEAEECFKKALAVDPDAAYLKIKLAQVYVRQKENKKAFDLLLPVADGLGDYSVEANVLLAGLSLAENRIISACAFFSQAIVRNPLKRDVYPALAEVYENAGMRTEAIQTYRKALDAFPADISFCLKLAELQMANQEYQAALELYHSLSPPDEHPLAQLVRKGIAECEWKLGNPIAAINALKTLLQINPLDQSTYRFLMKVQMEHEDFSGAYETALQWVGLGQVDLEPYLKLAFVSLKAGQVSEGIKRLQALEPSHTDSHQINYWLGRLHHATKDLEKAALYYEKACRLKPNQLEPHYYYVILLHDDGRVEEAIKHLTAVMTWKPGNAKLLNLLGYLYLEDNKLVGEATLLIERALAVDPQNAAFLDSMGWALYRQGKYPESLSYLLKAVEVSSSLVIMEHLVAAYDALGRVNEASEWQSRIESLQKKDDQEALTG